MNDKPNISKVTLGEEPPATVDDDGDSAALKQYTQGKYLLTHQVRLLEQFLHARKSEDRAKRCQELMVRLAEDRFTLGVVGQFKRGKSSLMNALIGDELLPTGVLPLTSAITILRFGSRKQLVVSYENSIPDREEPLSALKDYVAVAANVAGGDLHATRN